MEGGAVYTVTEQKGRAVVTEGVKKLEGRATFQEAADRLGYTKQGVHRLVWQSPNNPFNPDTDIRTVGDRPLLLVRIAKVDQVAKTILPEARHGQARLARRRAN